MRPTEDDIRLAGLEALPIERYLAGACTPEEAAAIERWVGADTVRARHIAELRDIRARSASLRAHPAAWSAWDVDTAWARAEQRTRSVMTRLPGSRFRGANDGTRSWFGRHVPYLTRGAIALAAASLALIVIRAPVRTGRGSAWKEFHAPAGARTRVALADGSIVTLAPASRLRVRLAAASGPRDFELEGEGYFEVRHDPARLLTVRAGGATITDVGTRFDVKAYPGDGAIRVAVADGRVGVADGRAGVASGAAGPAESLLVAGDVASVTNGTTVIEHGATVAAMTAWTDGRLEFAEAPLRDVLPDLARWLDLDLQVADSALLGRRLKSGFRAGPADEMLQAVALSVGARYVRHGRTVVFSLAGY